MLLLNPISSHDITTHRVDGHHRAIIGPGAQLHATVLFIKGKVGDDDLTVAFKDSRRCPRDVASVVQEHFGELDDGKVTICTATGQKRRRLPIIQVLMIEAFLSALSLLS